MADEAFALSPISARAAQPREEDYDAISEAFMETSRGRWFLGEYAKRNRNADTRMVLDAVSRIEQTIAAQKQPEPVPDNGPAEAALVQAKLAETRLVEALAVIRSAVDQARSVASTTLDGIALEQKLAPVRKGARIIHEIAWRWREIGADSRICDLIDSQISAIEAACGEISSTDPKVALSAAFGLIKDRLREFDDSDVSPPKATEEAVASPAPASARQNDAPAAAAEMAAASTETIPEAAISVAAVPDDVADATAEAVDVNTEDADALEAAVQEADAQDEAVLDLIALEMAAPDESDFNESGEKGELPDIDTAEAPVAELPPAAPEMMAPLPEPIATPAPATMMSQPLTQPPIEPAIEPSLGSTLIASGMLLRPNITPDPLAPIRRMSQAEKIAFFS